MQIEIYKMAADNDSLTITLEAICDSFSSLIWDIEYYRCGQFEVYIAASPRNIEIFQTGRMPGKYNNQYPLGDKLVCPICGSRLFQRSMKIQRTGSGWSCEIGENACRQFIIRASIVEQALINAYHALDIGNVENKLGSLKFRTEAETMLKYKREYPRMKKVGYWWVDDLVDHIEFGKHIRTTKELIALEAKGTPDPGDRTMKVYWKCGLVTTVPSDVFYDSDLPGRVAKRYHSQQMRKADKKSASKGKGGSKK